MNNPRHRRWLAVGMLAALILLFVFAVIIPLLSSFVAYHDEANDLLFRLHRQQKIVARKESVSQDLEKIKRESQAHGYLSNRSTEALASADLQEIIKTTVNDAGGQLTSTQGLPGKIDNGFNRVAVRVRMTANMETLRNVLLTFANSVPILVVDQLDITPVRATTRNRQGNNKMETSSQLNVSFQVVSFMRSATP